MDTFTKLSSDIVASSIWREPLHVKVVWITMLAMSDKNGMVSASIVGLANIAGVTIEQCEEAIQILISPDKYSRTQDFEGRRILAVDGGYALLNYAKYREKKDPDERARYMRNYMKDYRKTAEQSPDNKQDVNNLLADVNSSKQMLTPVNSGKPRLAQAEAEAEADTEEEKKEESGCKQPLPSTDVDAFMKKWNTIDGVPKIREMSSGRKKKLKVRKSEGMLEAIDVIARKIAMSDFLLGQNERGWKITVDWLLANDTNWLKVVEGRYDSKDQPTVGRVLL